MSCLHMIRYIYIHIVLESFLPTQHDFEVCWDFLYGFRTMGLNPTTTIPSENPIQITNQGQRRNFSTKVWTKMSRCCPCLFPIFGGPSGFLTITTVPFPLPNDVLRVFDPSLLGGPAIDLRWPMGLSQVGKYSKFNRSYIEITGKPLGHDHESLVNNLPSLEV